MITFKLPVFIKIVQFLLYLIRDFKRFQRIWRFVAKSLKLRIFTFTENEKTKLIQYIYDGSSNFEFFG